jgi:hypothetical protein
MSQPFVADLKRLRRLALNQEALRHAQLTGLPDAS